MDPLRRMLPFAGALILSIKVFAGIAGVGAPAVAVIEATSGFFSDRILCPRAVKRERTSTAVGEVGSRYNQRGFVPRLTCTDAAGKKTVHDKDLGLVTVGVILAPVGLALVLAAVVFVVVLRAASRRMSTPAR